MISFIQQLSIMAIPLLLAVIVHEVAHGWAAEKLGDPTARLAGRLTFNPLPHIDPIGSILIPAVLMLTHSPFLFGYAKPVPVNFHRLRRPKQDMVWVAAAGAAANLLMAFGFSLLLRGLLAADMLWGFPLFRWVMQPLLLMLRFGVVINCALAVFNLVPIPPLDGGKILMGLLPWKAAYQYSKLEPYGFFILIGLLMTRLLDWIIGPPMQFLLRLFLAEALLV